MPSISAINVDYTHVGRHVSGIERITIEQFDNVALSPLPIRTYKASKNRLSIVAGQMIGLPAHAIINPSDIYIFPGFPLSPFFSLLRDRAVLYVHDLFLLTRRTDLNRAAKLYMAPMFSVAVKKFRFFLTNSVDTAKKLRAYCHPDAVIVPYRPHIRNVFGVTLADRLQRPGNPDKIQVVSIGTIEPRKNFIGAANICDALSRLLGCEIQLHMIGRVGWCTDSHELRNRPNVTLHG
jgi:glycosyltransferase involved in cell wall biosynthesis